MDVSPIYCADQIIVPADLGDILKAFTKEVIRKQPQDLIQFSAQYFSSLATASKAVPKMVPPTKQQLKQLHAQLASTPSLPLQAALDACNTAGVSSATSSKLASSIASPDGTVTTSELLVLLLAMTGTNLAAALQGIFDIFGSSGQLSSAAFVELFGHLAQRDPDLGDASVASLEEALAGRESVSYSELCEDSPLKARLTVV